MTLTYELDIQGHGKPSCCNVKVKGNFLRQLTHTHTHTHTADRGPQSDGNNWEKSRLLTIFIL